MSLHFPLPKIRTFRFSLHTSRLSLHGEVTIVALKFAMSSRFPLPKFFSPSLFPLFQMARAVRRVIENPRQMIKSCPVLYCAWGTFGEREREIQRERERERERDRRQWRHHCRAKIGDEFTLSLAKNSHFSFLPSHFPSPSLFPLFQMARAARRVIENPRQMIKFCPVLFCSSHRKTESN